MGSKSLRGSSPAYARSIASLLCSYACGRGDDWCRNAIKLAPHLLGPIAIAAYSYMALVPVIIPMVVKLFCTKKELMINMKEQEKLYPSKTEIKNLRVLKIIFPIAVTTFFSEGFGYDFFLPFEAGDGVSSAALPFRIISCYRTHTSCIVRDGKCEGVGGNLCRGCLSFIAGFA